jgi:hypothetical protein
MATRKFLAGKSLALGLAVSLLAQQATATEELVVYGSAPAVVKVDQQAFRADVENYIRAMNEQLKETLDADLKRALAPKIEVASSTLQARG